MLHESNGICLRATYNASVSRLMQALSCTPQKIAILPYLADKIRYRGGILRLSDRRETADTGACRQMQTLGRIWENARIAAQWKILRMM
jgi:hypothetical protein